MTIKPLPTYAQHRVEASDPCGVVTMIQVRPVRRQPTRRVEAWDLNGSDDHARRADRAVTLFQAEYLQVLAGFLKRDVAFENTRRNLCIEGFNLQVARGRELGVGEVVLEITNHCHPCSRMDETLGVGGFAAMFGHGGFCARIVRPGIVRVGDVVRLVSTESEAQDA